MVPPHHVSHPRAGSLCSWRVVRLVAGVLPLLLGACVTTTGNVAVDCDHGDSYSCSKLGKQLLEQGEKQEAENAFALSCEKGNVDDCTAQGQLMLDRGELASAEAPLQKGHDAENLAATRALESLYQTRGEPGDAERVNQLRWEEPAIEKPDREFTFWWRPSPTGETTYAIAYTFQPMVFWARRMSLGLHFAGNARGGNELNLAMSYQHYLTPEIVPYGTALMGAAFQNHSANVGGEFGVKLCLGEYGHLNLGGGISVGSPLHFSVGLGVNALPIEILLLMALGHL